MVFKVLAMKALPFLMGVPFLFSGVLFAAESSSLPAKKMLQQISASERQQRRVELRLLARKPYAWEPTVLPRSMRSWMMEEFSSDTWHKIEHSDKL